VSRLTVAVDRLCALLLGMVLVVGGAAVAIWGTDRVQPLNSTLGLSKLQQATTESWWPWVVGLGGVAAVLVGLRWLVAHVPTRRSGPLRLPGTSRAGRLTADGGSAADAAAEAFASTPGVASARGTLIDDRGQLVARLVATIDSDADLPAVAQAADEVSAQLQNVLGRKDLRCRVDLRLARRERPRARVQ
jgi:hypothetical protein